MIQASPPTAPCRSAGRGRPMGSWPSLGLLLLVLAGTAAWDSLFEPTPPRVESFEAVIGGFRTGPPGHEPTHEFLVFAFEGDRPRFHRVPGLPGASVRAQSVQDGTLVRWTHHVGPPVRNELVTLDLRTLSVVERVPSDSLHPTFPDEGRFISPTSIVHVGSGRFLGGPWGEDPIPGSTRSDLRGIAVIDRDRREVMDILEPIRVWHNNILVLPPMSEHPDGIWVFAGAAGNAWGQDSELLFVDPGSREVVDRTVIEASPQARSGTFRQVHFHSADQVIVGVTRTGLLFRSRVSDGSVTFLPRPPGRLRIAVAPDGEIFSAMVTDGREGPGGGMVFRHPPELAGGYEVFADLRQALSVVERTGASSAVLTDIAVSGDGERVYVTAGGHNILTLFGTHPAVLVVLDRYTGELLAEHELGRWGFPWIQAL
jgi:hypothetical protein